MSEKKAFIVKTDTATHKERLMLSKVRIYRQEYSNVYIIFESGESEVFNFRDTDHAGEFMIALDQHFGVGEGSKTIELKP